MNHHRPLTPLELALLRAVVELGEEACGAAIHKAIAGPFGQRPSASGMLYALKRLEEDGFLKHIDVPREWYERAGRPTRYWRPAIDLTDILAAAGAGGDDGDDKETR